MITVSSSGSFDNIGQWLLKASKLDASKKLKPLGKQMVKELEPATPVDTGKTAKSWNSEVRRVAGGAELTISNSADDGFNVVQGIRHGHGTGTGGYVKGKDFVTPIVEPLIENATKEILRSVK